MESVLTFSFDATYSVAFNCGIRICDAVLTIELDNKIVNCLTNAERTDGTAIQGEFGIYTPITFKKETESGIVLTTRFEDYETKVFVSLQIENKSESTVILGKCSLMNTYAGGHLDVGGVQDVRINCRDGWQYHSETRMLISDPSDPIYDVSAPNADGHSLRDITRHRTNIMGDLFSPDRKACLDTSFLTFDRANSVIYYSVVDGKAQAEALCDFSGYELQPGMFQTSEVFRVAANSSFDTCMKAYADDVVKQYNPRFIDNAGLGGLGWTWDSGRTEDYCSQDLILRNAKAIFEKLGGFGFSYYWVSICNLKNKIPGHWLDCDYKQIPSGYEGLAKQLESYGLKLGFWIAPYWIPDKFSDQPEAMKNQLLRQDGNPVKDYVYWLRGISGKYPPEQRLNFLMRDGSSKEAQDYIRDIFKKYREMGVRYYMIDFMRGAAGGLYGPFEYNEYEDKTKIAGPEVYRELLKVIREAAGEDTYIVSSTGPSFINIGCVDGSRTGPDIGEGRAAIPGYSSYPGTYHINNTPILRSGVRNFASVYHINGKLFHADSFNVVSIDKPIPLSEAQTTITMSAMFASPMMLGDLIYEISPDRLELLKKALPQNKVSETAIPVDLFDCLAPDCPHIYHLPIERRWGRYGVLALLNIDDVNRTYEVDLNELGYDGDCALYDFWDERYLGIKNGKLSFEVAAHSTRVIRITPYLGVPQLIGTDMHILQGAVEIVSTDYDENTLTVCCKRPVGERGAIKILAPIDFIPQVYNGFHISRVENSSWLLISKEINFETPTVTVVLPFKKSENEKFGKDVGDERFE